ncbi:MAG: glycosyl transferase family 1 [Blastopirellula sp.]|nr:MAG: glycosyl transferase family 1 [Blastopirellula sp.]
MRVAHIITRMIIGGAQENTLYNCADLIEQYDDDVLLITGPAVGPEGSLLQRNNNTIVPVQNAQHLIRNIHPWHDTLAYFELKKILRQFKPDVVHTHSAKAGLLGRMAATSLKVPAVIHTVHGAPFHPYQNAVARNTFIACEKYAAKKCHKMVCVADAMSALMLDAGIASPEKYETVYSGMEVEPFLEGHKLREASRAELGFEPQHVVIGKIARLFHLKGHEYVIQAAKEIVENCPDVRFLFIGDGILQDQYRQQIAEAGLTDYFVMPGLVSPSEIPKMISAMDILVHTSLREGLARALPQALLSGKPAVSFDVDGAREVVINDETGALLPAKDVTQLTSALIRLANDSDLRKKLGDEGQRRMKTQFPHQVMTARLREIYQEVLDFNGKSV